MIQFFRGGWDVYHGTDEHGGTLGSGQFRQVGDKSVLGVREGEWRLRGEEGSREFTMREWEDKERLGRITREGGEWDLRSGRGWGEGGITSTDSVDAYVMKDVNTEDEQPVETVCCCDELTG